MVTKTGLTVLTANAPSHSLLSPVSDALSGMEELRRQLKGTTPPARPAVNEQLVTWRDLANEASQALKVAPPA